MDFATETGLPTIVLCDADDCLFPSERLAFVAAAAALNQVSDELDLDARFEPGDLQRRAAGMNFRKLVCKLVDDHGVTVSRRQIDRWVQLEQDDVARILGHELRPDGSVQQPLARLAGHASLALVSSSGLRRLVACLDATGLAPLFPPARRFSAEDSISPPSSKPDPAIYRHALSQMRAHASAALAVEDSVAGVRSAVAAGCMTLGNIAWVPVPEREVRAGQLIDAGADQVVESWFEVESFLGDEYAATTAAFWASV